MLKRDHTAWSMRNGSRDESRQFAAEGLQNTKNSLIYELGMTDTGLSFTDIRHANVFQLILDDC